MQGLNEEVPAEEALSRSNSSISSTPSTRQDLAGGVEGGSDAIVVSNESRPLTIVFDGGSPDARSYTGRSNNNGNVGLDEDLEAAEMGALPGSSIAGTASPTIPTSSLEAVGSSLSSDAIVETSFSRPAALSISTDLANQDTSLAVKQENALSPSFVSTLGYQQKVVVEEEVEIEERITAVPTPTPTSTSTSTAAARRRIGRHIKNLSHGSFKNSSNNTPKQPPTPLSLSLSDKQETPNPSPAAAAATVGRTPTRHMRDLSHGSFTFKVSAPDQDGLVKEQIAEVRTGDDAMPMDYMSRKRLRFRKMLHLSGGDPLQSPHPLTMDQTDSGHYSQKHEAAAGTTSSQQYSHNTNVSDLEHGDDGPNPQPPLHYHIKTRQRAENGFLGNHGKGIILFRPIRYVLAAMGLTDDPVADNFINGPINCYVSWTFRASFVTVFMSMLLGFMLWVTFFAVMLMFAGRYQTSCIFVAGAEFFDYDKQGSFSDVFQMSWHTFSTVGYGSVFPSTSVQMQKQQHCSMVQFLCTVESFIGVLFAGFCGAVLFGKINRVQSNAKVMFSEPICIRYGSGVSPVHRDKRQEAVPETVGGLRGRKYFRSPPGGGGGGSGGGGGGGSSRNINIPCPILEFRVVNENHHLKEGAIVDASLSCVSSVVIDVPRPGNTFLPTLSERFETNGPSMLAKQASILFTGSKHEKDKKQRTSARRTFSKVDIETAQHPFFQRVWNARHTLDANSPLLRPEVARRIRNNNGFWPADLNNYEDVRDALSFTQIIVSFSGVSNFTATSVYAQKIYDLVDVNVGYQFAPVLYKKDDLHALGVDIDMLNDIMEQDGGGAEPLMAVTKSH